MTAQLIQDLLVSLESLSEPKRAEMAKTYYPTRSKVIGVTNPNIKLVSKELTALSKAWTSRQKIDLAIKMVDEGTFELQQLAYEYLENNKKDKQNLTPQDVEDLAVRLDNWVMTDYYGPFILGYAWRENIIPTTTIESFLYSEDLFWRRTALAATIALNQKSRGGKGDPPRTLSICQQLVDDRADMVVKALSWSLRCLLVRERDAVISFMEEYEDRLPRRVVREVWNKLHTGLKN